MSSPRQVRPGIPDVLENWLLLLLGPEGTAQMRAGYLWCWDLSFRDRVLLGCTVHED